MGVMKYDVEPSGNHFQVCDCGVSYKKYLPLIALEWKFCIRVYQFATLRTTFYKNIVKSELYMIKPYVDNNK